MLFKGCNNGNLSPFTSRTSKVILMPSPDISNEAIKMAKEEKTTNKFYL